MYARLEPTSAGEPLFFCAHLDTVPPDGELRPVVEEGVIRNAGGTILGGDNKAAVVQMLEGTRNLVEPAGAAPLAAALRLRERLARKTVARAQSGGNITLAQLRDLLERAL